MAIDNSGNVYVTGGSFGNGTERDFLTIKYNSNGDTLWTKRFNGPGFEIDESVFIVLDNEANVYITGYSDTGDNLDYHTIKYNSAGIQQWASFYNGPAGPFGSEDRPHFLSVDDSGNVYVTGESSAGLIGIGLDMYATVKYNKFGDSVWTARYKGPGVEGLSQAYALDVDDHGNVFVTGRSDPFSAFGNNFDMLTIKYNAEGDSQWVHRYNGPGNSSDVANDIEVDSDGNIIVTGLSVRNNASEYFTIKFNQAGDTLWTARYNGPGGLNSASSLSIDKDNNIYVTGLSRGNGTERDYATLKYNSSGDQIWVQRYNGPGNGDDEANAMTVDYLGNIYITGNSFGGGMDYATIKYNSGVTSVENESVSINQCILNQNYPNPFNPVTKITFVIGHQSVVSLKVYDVLGNELATLVKKELPAGKYEVVFDGQELSSGIYFFRLKVKDFIDVRKMVLMK